MANNSSHNKMYSEATYRIGGKRKKSLKIDCKYSLPSWITFECISRLCVFKRREKNLRDDDDAVIHHLIS